MNYKEIFDMIIDELTENALAEFRDENDEINVALLEQEKTDEQIQEYDFSDKERDLIERYVSQIYEVNAREKNYLYIKGIKDGVKLLKDLEMV